MVRTVFLTIIAISLFGCKHKTFADVAYHLAVFEDTSWGENDALSKYPELKKLNPLTVLISGGENEIPQVHCIQNALLQLTLKNDTVLYGEAHVFNRFTKEINYIKMFEIKIMIHDNGFCFQKEMVYHTYTYSADGKKLISFKEIVSEN